MATEKLQVYKCQVCGIIAEVLDGGAGELVCCGQPMTLLTANTTDATREKHVPVIEETDVGVRIKVGSEPHPMLQKHFIEWIEVLAGGKAYRRFLSPGDSPEATFEVKADDIDSAREYCNLHGLWQC
jgi:superoxide reductase